MRFLLDTHALIWWLADDRRLSQPARRAVANQHHEIHVSAASAWEVTTKHRLGKLPDASRLAEHVEATIRRERFIPMPITMAHAEAAGRLDEPHGDPFDRMLVAQALVEGLVLISNEAVFDRFGVKRVW